MMYTDHSVVLCRPDVLAKIRSTETSRPDMARAAALFPLVSCHMGLEGFAKI
jgi:hypothetical protein